MRCFLSLVFINFSIIQLLSQEQESLSLPLITTYTPSEYLGGIQNWDINQDTTGYIYVANNYGLLEFDGADWSLFEIPGTTKTRAITIDSKTNRIYTGGQRKLGYFEHLSNGLNFQDLTNQIPDSIPTDEIWNLVQYDNQIIANINGRIGFIDGDRLRIQKGISNIEFISRAENDIIAASTNSFYVLDKSSNEFKLYGRQINKNCRGAIKIDESYYLFTYEGEIFKYLTESVLQKISSNADNLLRNAKINRVLKLKNGNIAIGTQNNGLLILNKDLVLIRHLTKNRGLNHRTVISLYEDQFNNLWVGLNNGICVVELGSPFSLINENVGLEGTGYTAASFNKEVFLGTSSGLFKRKKTNLSKDFNSGYAVIPGSEGLVNNISIIDKRLILSHHEGSFQLNQNGIDQFFNNTGTWNFKKFDEKLIGGTYEGFFLFEIKGPTISLDRFLNGLNESSRVFEFANDSTLWMTHGYKGAYKIALQADTIKSVKHYTGDDGFPSDILISVYKIDDELIFTAETGIYQYTKQTDRFEPHPFLNAWFKDKHVSKIKQASNDLIYFIADGEIGILRRQSIGVYEEEAKLFRKINRYISDDLENLNVLDNGDLLIGAKEGFIRYQPTTQYAINENFRTFLKNATITNANDSTQTLVGTFFSSPKINFPKAIHFEFSAPYFDGLNDLKYAYRLTPYDENWSEWSTTNWKEYTNLSSGEYIFELKAVNIYGDESEVSQYAFIINPRWYESNTAVAIYSLIVLFIFATVLYTREKKHKSEKKIIHQSKEEEIRSKEREISEFSAKTSQQIQQLKNESLKKEIDHKNSQLASVTMHLLSKNEFVMSIRKKLNEVASDSKTENGSLQKIVKSIDKNIDEDEAWETFVHHFDQVHGNFLHKLKEAINLTPQETKLCAYLKMNMSTKDIANLMNITVRGVELARYRLRKKLGINRDVNLVSYLDRF